MDSNNKIKNQGAHKAMLIKIPQELQHFFQIVFVNFNLMSASQRRYIKATVCAILFSQGKLTMEKVGSILPDFQRTKSAVSLMFSNKKYWSREVAWQSVMIVCKMAEEKMPKSKKSNPWVFIFDTTHRTRFGKLLESLIGTHGSKSKQRFYPLVWSMLIAPTGERIALPCPTWLTQEYAEKKQVKYQTQPSLAVKTCRWLGEKLAECKLNFDLVIVADSAFDCEELWRLCQKHNTTSQTTWTLITPCSKERCLGRNGIKASRIPGAKVHKQFTFEDLCEAKRINPLKSTQVHLRSQQKLSSKQKPDFYRYASKQLRVSNIGDAKVVMSCKLKSKKQAVNEAPRKFLLCSNLDFDSEQIISYYTIRWEIETFFREQKSDLAFRDFQARTPEACYCFVHHLTIAFNFLEFFRMNLVEEQDCSEVEIYESLPYIRTRNLKRILHDRYSSEQIEWILHRASTDYGRRRLWKILTTLKTSLPSIHFLPNCQRASFPETG